MKDINDEIISYLLIIYDKWTQYFNNLLNVEVRTQETKDLGVEEEDNDQPQGEITKKRIGIQHKIYVKWKSY